MPGHGEQLSAPDDWEAKLCWEIWNSATEGKYGNIRAENQWDYSWEKLMGLFVGKTYGIIRGKSLWEYLWEKLMGMFVGKTYENVCAETLMGIFVGSTYGNI